MQCRGQKLVKKTGAFDYCQLERGHEGKCRFDSLMAKRDRITAEMTVKAVFKRGTKLEDISRWIAACPGAKRVGPVPSDKAAKSSESGGSNA